MPHMELELAASDHLEQRFNHMQDTQRQTKAKLNEFKLARESLDEAMNAAQSDYMRTYGKPAPVPSTFSADFLSTWSLDGGLPIDGFSTLSNSSLSLRFYGRIICF